MNILFVCSGNVSRSYLAEVLLKHEINRLRLEHISVASAGLYAYPGMDADPKMDEYLSDLGISGKKHESRQMIREDTDWADLILVMEKDHREMIERLWPQSKAKVELLAKYISKNSHGDDVVDPFGRSPYHYRIARAQITLAIEALCKTLCGERNPNAKDQNHRG